MTNWRSNGSGWDGDASVFDWEWPVAKDGSSYDKSYGLPNVWITVQAWDPATKTVGRDCIGHYTPDEDPEGWEALRFGAEYYEEGMSCDPEDEHERRIMCFQAAELLYLHASKKGNPYADLNLGYVYSYDRCEGSYWDRNASDPAPEGAREAVTWLSSHGIQLDGKEELPDNVAAMLGWLTSSQNEFSCDEYAYKHYRKAAEAGLAEACYKLGDLLREGRGCACDLAEAFSWYKKAYDLGTNDTPVVWGSAALRLGRAFEEGEGCEQSFESACTWYERATTGLHIAVRCGEHWYRGALRHAEKGLARTKQELNSEY